ncbi:MAG: divalent-cation tolerance protein CutA [Simkaniaceae bacterium]|nr:divalent-cation tolerance protein CutA [Simkaniaceae bacterium]
MIYLFWTCAQEKEANAIIHELLEKKLIACASVIPNVTSHYWWEGKIESSSEVKVILKSRKEHFDAIDALIHKRGSYDVAELCAITPTEVSENYLQWLKRNI